MSGSVRTISAHTSANVGPLLNAATGVHGFGAVALSYSVTRYALHAAHVRRRMLITILTRDGNWWHAGSIPTTLSTRAVSVTPVIRGKQWRRTEGSA